MCIRMCLCVCVRVYVYVYVYVFVYVYVYVHVYVHVYVYVYAYLYVYLYVYVYICRDVLYPTEGGAYPHFTPPPGNLVTPPHNFGTPWKKNRQLKKSKERAKTYSCSGPQIIKTK